MHQLLNQHVLVKDKVSGVEIGGVLQFVGTLDHFPTWGLVCTVDRCPGIRINSAADIKKHPGYRISTDVTKGRQR
jgi:hypothetical protein